MNMRLGALCLVAGSLFQAAAQAPAKSEPEVVTETAPKPELPDRYVAYFFDDIHMQPGDLLQARQAANHHLDKALDAGSRAGVFR